MDVTILVAKVLGVYLVVSGLFLIMKGKTVPHLLKDFFGHPAIVYLTGAILIFLSSMYLLQYNVWDGTWRTPITVIVWLVLLKGIVYLFAPRALSEVAIKSSRRLFGAYGFVAVVLGIALFFIV